MSVLNALLGGCGVAVAIDCCAEVLGLTIHFFRCCIAGIVTRADCVLLAGRSL